VVDKNRQTSGGAAPPIHPSGQSAPKLDAQSLPRHIAVVMDGNGRWAAERSLPRTEGHRAGEEALVEVVAGAIEVGIEWLSVYAFSTENWKRSPSEVRFLMSYSRQVLRRRRDLFHSWNVKIAWSGLRQRLWPSVIRELDEAAALTRNNSGLNLTLCVDYGGRAEIAQAVRRIALTAEQRGATASAALTEAAIQEALSTPDVDLFWRTSGEQRLSNYLLWQSAYAELVFSPKLWPQIDRRDLWQAVAEYAARQRRFGAA
jgi:undecaprenyl diphosphate synthase